jgi:hypothetical protein
MELRENADDICVASIRWDHVGKGLGLGLWPSGVDSTDLSQIVGQLIPTVPPRRKYVSYCRLHKTTRL